MTFLRYSSVLALGVLALTVACSTGDIAQELELNQSIRLLTNSSDKSWAIESKTENGTAIQLTDCEQSQLFEIATTGSSPTILGLGKSPGCDLEVEELDTLFTANWFITETSADTLYLTEIEGDISSPIVVMKLTARQLSLTYSNSQGDLIYENYTNPN